MKKTIILAIAIVFTICFCACGTSDKSEDAWVCAQDVVESKLKAPSTAKFCNYNSDNVVELGDGKYRIKGYVDSQNSFGAMIRSEFTVILTLTENGYKDATCTFN